MVVSVDPQHRCSLRGWRSVVWDTRAGERGNYVLVVQQRCGAV
jgi:hypothetical protein